VIRLLPLLLLVACNAPPRQPEPGVRELLGQIAAMCVAYDNASVMARMDTVTEASLRESHKQADALCDGVAVPDTLQP
jgi:hypothetical protein